MIQKNFRTAVLVMASGLAVFGVLSHAQATNSSPNQKMVPTPMQIALQNALQTSTQNAAHSIPPNPPNAAKNTQNSTANTTQSAQPVQPTQASTAQLPAEFNAAIADLQNAKSDLQKAGNKWGGHKVPAIRLISRALDSCGHNQTTNPAETNSSSQDERTAMQSGIAQLNTAKSDFEKVGKDSGGCRAAALSLIDQALAELQAGIEFAKSHNTY